MLNNMTVIQELLEYSGNLYLNDKIENKFHFLVSKIISLEKKEKQQIIKAFDTADNINTGNYQTGEDYYNSTYPSRVTE